CSMKAYQGCCEKQRPDEEGIATKSLNETFDGPLLPGVRNVDLMKKGLRHLSEKTS
ncbi:unnamed protein product, partial [marine sediment metagenome]